MSTLREPRPAKLVVGMFMKRRDLIESAVTAVSREYGDIDFISPWLSFDYTSYYTAEMGEPLYRRLISFKDLIAQDALPQIKHFTCKLEIEFSENDRRSINIDPGYILSERFILASGKNFTHRVYIGSRVYADLTLIYSRGKFRTLAWTYPDYASREIQYYLTLIRNKYMHDIDMNSSAEKKQKEK